MKRLVFSLLLALGVAAVHAQDAPFGVRLEAVRIAGFEGRQSFACGQHDGKWLLLGGRKDGLHRRQPFASFDQDGQGADAVVVDPQTGRSWHASLSLLPSPLREQLSSTNMQFRQDGPVLYLVGGYGFSPSADDHMTFPHLTAVDVPSAIRAVMDGDVQASSFRQITDSLFCVTGGRLEKIYDRYYLVGGHRFDGRYNPRGMPSFVQRYTDAIRSFRLIDNGDALVVTDVSVRTDADRLHRRDFNLAPQILPGGEEGLTAFSGVFRSPDDIPFLDCIVLDSSGYRADSAFSQYFNHYHCALLPLYSAVANEMHTVFFGGIAQYFMQDGLLAQDYNVPFVKTIARVTRNGSGSMAEYRLPGEMPGFLGAGSEFLPLPGVKRYANGVLDLDALTADTTVVGYIVGGIASTAANVFWINTGEESRASDAVFRVKVIRGPALAQHEMNPQSVNPLKLQVMPFLYEGFLAVTFRPSSRNNVRLLIRDISGRTWMDRKIRPSRPGREIGVKCAIRGLKKGGVFLVQLETTGEKVLQKIIVEP